MSVTLFAANLLELAAAAVTVTPAPLYPERLYDRDIVLRMQGASGWGMAGVLGLPLGLGTTTITIDVDLGSAQAVTGWAVLGHTLAGAVELLSGASAPAATSRDSFTAVSGTDAFRTIASVSARHWRVTAPAGAIGELLLGVPRVITQPPSLPTGKPHLLGNVRGTLTPGWSRRAVQLSGRRVRLAYHWNGLSLADLTTYEAAFDEIAHSAKSFLLQDDAGALRWVFLVNVSSEPSARGLDLFDLDATFEEAQAA